ncbi:TPA: recombination protein NinB [Pasteurella multocida]|nr:recombination protein NinB [Pasteurella multocida]HDR1459322.1 recombination protein NinB [Pasteurella multocida]HDR1461986.1 recombination protein NinB [Pasteurella multocida]HDR1493147.1 recombination protein NinB [Pasteurella multocida]HDR1521363.1 recombination protein NinB [Pasteurella multocida]
MEIKNQFFLRSEQVRLNAIEFIKTLPLPKIVKDEKGNEIETNPLVIDIKPRTRNLEQNAKFHAMCQDVADQLEFMGRKLTMEQWKVLFISGHAMAINEKAEIVPGLEGEFVNIRESSAKMSVKRMASLIEYVTAYGISHGVRFNDRYGFWGK